MVYISFGSKTAMSGDRFFTIKVDKDDQKDAEHFLNKPFFEKTNNKGLVIKGWAEQQEILGHPAIGGFLSHCGWNSVMELQHGDQRLNAQVVEDAGLGLWERNWDWGPNSILMTNENLRGRAKKVKEEARKVVGRGGSSDMVIRESNH
ncbi:hypothetical protein ACJRO7_021331 [Eucalyptus globulus]|uniref:Uncharacterized protein n=1 Tax=Eucalyptus globulus TaxID=34317 RepID=A0ABD3KLA3_EUCGL